MNGRRDRRQFGKEVVCLAAGAVAGGGAGSTSAAQPDQPKLDPQAVTLQALMDIVRTRHGAHLNDEQLKRVRQKIEAGLLMAELLKKTRLENGDEPDFVFQIDN